MHKNKDAIQATLYAEQKRKPMKEGGRGARPFAFILFL
jgi:hypothetical protein